MTVQALRPFAVALLTSLAIASPAMAGGWDEPGQSTFDLQIGGFVVVAPKYEGSEDYEVRGFPIAIPSGLGTGTGMVQVRGPDDVRLRLLTLGALEAGPLAGWRFSREDDDADRLLGLGDVDGGLVVGGYVGYRMGLFMPFLAYGHQVTGDDTGGVLRFGAEAKAEIASISMTFTGGATYADEDYMDAYFGVTQAQSAASVARLAAYDAGADIKDVFIGFSADMPITDVWTLRLSGRYSRLLGDAADSPIVESEDQFFGGLGVTYRFSIAR